MSLLKENALVALLRERATFEGNAADVVLGIGDDAALVVAPPGMALAWTTDTLVAGVHFPLATAPADIGWKTLAVNLSDLAAMGAEPRWVSLNLALPAFDSDWIQGFCDGFLALARATGVQLIGGDCTRAAQAVLTVTAIGAVDAGLALRRDGGRVGDAVWISGWPGEAAAGLAGLDHADPALRARLDRPTPRIALGRALRGIATAALDVSDGVLLDLDRLCAASGCGAELQLEALPVSALLAAASADLAEARERLLSGGDDYELLFAAPADQQATLEALAAQLDLPLHRIGTLTAATGVRVRDGHGREQCYTRRGYEHHAEPA